MDYNYRKTLSNNSKQFEYDSYNRNHNEMSDEEYNWNKKSKEYNGNLNEKFRIKNK
jgi:hypothetical protein